MFLQGEFKTETATEGWSHRENRVLTNSSVRGGSAVVKGLTELRGKCIL